MKKYCILFILCYCCFLCQAQGPSGSHVSVSELQSLIPVSPNAASLGKYGAMPVGYYTGIPDISIPIYEINTGKIRLPISISYHAGGLKVEEIASWVGMGWSLNAGGVISRQTRGRPDESTYGFLERFTDVRKFLNNQMSVAEKTSFLSDAVSGDVDTQPDVFYYNTPNGAGMFFYDTTGSIITIPVSRQSITGAGSSWTVTDIDGTRYDFEDAEQTTTTPITGSIQSTEHGYLGPAYTSVFLSRIVSADGTEEMHFYYDSTYYIFNTISSQTRYVIGSVYSQCPPMDPTTTNMSNVIYGRRLKRIVFNGGEILFNEVSTSRMDLPGDHALDNIVVRNYDSSFYKKIKFNYSYRIGSGVSNQNNNGTDEIYRLFLDSLDVENLSSEKIEKYSFDYNYGTLPSRTSFDQDYWGYYNAAGNGLKFVPTTYLQTESGLLTFNGANRNTAANFSQIGMLNKITYPTGGSTHYEYENNIISIDTPGTIYNSQQNGYLGLGTTLNATVFSDVFTVDTFSNITGATVPVVVTLNNGGCGGSNQTLGCPLVNLTQNGVIGSIPITSSGTIQLAAGTYTITADLSEVTDPVLFNSFYVSLNWPKAVKSTYNGSTLYQRLDGGHRIRRIYDENAFGDTLNVKTYDYNLPGTEISSGSALSIPEYVSSIHKIITDNPIPSQTNVHDCEYKVFSSSTNYPLLSTKGGYVGYSFVRETLGVNGAGGVNEYTYTSPATFADINYTDFPYAPSTSYDWKRGFLLKQSVKRKSGSGFQPVQEKFMAYSESMDYSVKGLKVGFNSTDYLSQGFDLATGWFVLDADSLVEYDQVDSNRKQAIVTKYGYSNSALQPNLIMTLNSKGEEIIKKTKYSTDYTDYGGADRDALAVQKLKEQNMILPIEKKIVQKANGIYKVINGSITSYDPVLLKPSAVWELFPGTTSDTTMSFITAGGLQKDNAYERRLNFSNYSPKKNIVSEYKQNDLHRSYILDYGELYPVAECLNASAEEIAYTSFEADGKGGWTGISLASFDSSSRGITGKKYYKQDNFSISKSGLDTGKYYTISYWSLNGQYQVAGTQPGYPKVISSITLGSSNWTQYEHLVSGQANVTVSGTGAIDELRLYPQDAQMTTYTYSPMVGMTSQCNASGHISYYEYDSLGRLLYVRDQNYHILKAYEYKYFSQH